MSKLEGLFKKEELLKTIAVAAVYTTVSYFVATYILKRYFPEPVKKSEEGMHGMCACNCEQPWPYGRQ